MKHALQKILEEAGIECRSYSGKAMYGKSCLGIELQGPLTFGSFLSKIAQIMFTTGAYSWDEIDGAYPEVEQECKDIVRGLQCYRQDSLGMGTIIYFPDVPYSDEITPV